MKYFDGDKVIDDTAGTEALVFIGDAATRTVRAYATGNSNFKATDNYNILSDGSQNWKVTENALIADDGSNLQRLAGHIGFWFAWQNYYGAKCELAKLN